MKKNVFSRTIAVLASAAVLGAASMMSASAAGESLSLTSAEGKAGETVTLNVVVACNNNFESLDTVVNFEGVTGATAQAAGGASVASDAGDGYVTVVAYGSAALADGAVATIDFTIPADAVAGTTYDVTFGGVNTFAIFGGDDIAASVPTSGGTITVVEDEPETTAAPEETTAAPEETTAAATTAAAKTGAPKTGTAGVAVAVAGLVTAGAAAVVLKKRH